MSSQAVLHALCAQGVVYITDHTSRHEITSWRLDEAAEVAPAVIGGAPGEQGLACYDACGWVARAVQVHELIL